MNFLVVVQRNVNLWLRFPIGFLLVSCVLALVASNVTAQEPSNPNGEDRGRTITAYVVALDQVITYNRFGSFNPNGMIYALARDVVDDRTGKPIDLHGEGGSKPKAGGVSLRKNKRPRPLVLRVNKGDTLKIVFTNLLSPSRRGADKNDIQEPCGISGKIADGIPEDEKTFDQEHGNDAPATRCASIVVSGMTPVNAGFKPGQPRRSVDLERAGISGIPPGETVIYHWFSEREGTYLFFSNSPPAGGEGDGGSLVHGLFGAVHVEPKGSEWFRSQVTEEVLEKTLKNKEAYLKSKMEGSNIYPIIDYNKKYEEGDLPANMKIDEPVLRILNRDNEIIYGDLNAIIDCSGFLGDASLGEHSCVDANFLRPDGNLLDSFDGSPSDVISNSFREFTVIFHDELKTIHPFKLLNDEPQLAGIRDGFAINYGASGLGTILLANRNRIGPAKDCVECFYEEFFLQSWANGDPALMVEYPPGLCNPYSKYPEKCSVNAEKPVVPFPEDPSNVHHSYLGDNVKFRNLHAGPKETHVFHLHAHQWVSQGDKGTYLDSQTIGPEQGFAYDIFYGGSGNRNLTPGDSIFHCHLYPHFAQGMWELWRVHDVLEDGSRFLPDGEMGPGTDPMTGHTIGGTPIPALLPMPTIAMAPLPKYGGNELGNEKIPGFPGYPFYIPGEAGHRVPQPPLDMVDADNGGLPRHRILSGEREAPNPEEALATGNFLMKLKTAEILILPRRGTPLERAAMRFHALRDDSKNRELPSEENTEEVGYLTQFPTKPEKALFKVNGLLAKEGAPFADPCPPYERTFEEAKTKEAKTFQDELMNEAREIKEVGWWSGAKNITSKSVTYEVSAIELDMVVNSHGWHDPQARINVLKDDVFKYEGVTTREAEPFFFRAHSGDCITFKHTNQTPAHLELDDFQVATPTDIIGQHIHLVKFDVTSSDGSANGWNYEDGTFAREAIKERIEAANAVGGGVFEEKEGVKVRYEKQLEVPGKKVYQTTIQRWWADPLTGREPDSEQGSGKKKDHTIRTVFTHDHFAPSSIQQHGFYGALVIEPEGSEWFTQDFNFNKDDGLLRDQKRLKEGKAVGTRVIIQMGDPNNNYKGTHREFMLAIADFALLYDPKTLPKEGTIRPEFGNPVDPPKKPEAISTDHHNPYLVNYKHDPIPLRIAEFNLDGTFKGIKDGDSGDMAYVFNSELHGDPFLKPFKAYEGDSVQLRVIQGAQEVQHTMTIHGLRWNRNVGANRELHYVNAQEIGISEHFEMNLPVIGDVGGGANAGDYLLHFGSVDDLWNGAWGILRSFGGPDKQNPPSSECPGSDILNCEKIKETLGALSNNDDGKIASREGMISGGSCPGFNITQNQNGDRKRPPNRKVVVEAWRARDLIPPYYNGPQNIYAPNALVFVGKIGNESLGYDSVNEALGIEIQEIRSGVKQFEPMVLRANAGDCLEVFLTNKISSTLQALGEAELPRITTLRADWFPPSKIVSLHPQLLSYYIRDQDGTSVGYNNVKGNPQGLSMAGPNQEANYTWYAGTIEPDPEKKGRVVGFPREFGAINLTSFGDVIKHGTQGLVGALIIEPEGWVICSGDQEPRPNKCPSSETYGNSNLTAEIFTDETMTDHFREFVLIYQDGLNLYKSGRPIFDCHICDDSYDLGEKAVNYRTEPFWARLGMPFETCKLQETGEFVLCDDKHDGDTNHMVYPRDFFMPSYKGVETTIFKTTKGHKVRFRVLQPAGRARQRSFQVYGHDYDDYGIPNFGSAHSSLISVGKGITADLIGGAKEGCWIYRDGPNFMFSGGAWGLFEVGAGNCSPPTEE